MTTPEAPREAGKPRNPISRGQLEVVASRSVGLFGIVFGLQTLPATLAQLPDMTSLGGIVYIVAIYGGLLLAALSTLLQWGVLTANAFFAFAYVAGLVFWPLAVVDAGALAGDKPWLWYLCTVATACAAIALRVWQAAVYTLVVPLIYGVLRTLPSGGEVDALLASLDAAYAIILGGVVLVIITMLRAAASDVDSAQGAALTQYGAAVRQHAIEVERVQVDAIVHDSVLTTLLAASSAETPESRTLVARMARDAIGHLDSADQGAGSAAVEQLTSVSRRIQGVASEYSAGFALVVEEVPAVAVSAHVADAIASAATQAMVNSMQHAGSGPTVLREVRIHPNGADGIEVQVNDTGCGFRADSVGTGRLGVRVSILERMATAGGDAELDSIPGEGTRVRIRWPSVQSQETPTTGIGDAGVDAGDASEGVVSR